MAGTKHASTLPEGFAEFLESGVSISIATRDAGLTPYGTRIFGVKVDPDGSHVTAFLTSKTAGPILENLEANGQVALCFDRPSDSRACQIKGVFVESRRCRPSERAEIDRQAGGFFADLETIGFPSALLSGWVRWPAVAVRFRVTDVFHQTPGPGAGERVE
jgi:hypothetical protein